MYSFVCNFIKKEIARLTFYQDEVEVGCLKDLNLEHEMLGHGLVEHDPEPEFKINFVLGDLEIRSIKGYDCSDYEVITPTMGYLIQVQVDPLGTIHIFSRPID